MTRLLACVTLALTVCLPAIASAQPEANAEIPERVINIREGELLTGELYRPGEELIEASLGIGSSSLIPVRMEFVDKIIDSWEQI